MSATMQQFASQQNIFCHSNYMSASSTLAEDVSPSDCDEGERHEAKLQLQDRKHNPIAFHAEMMGNIMYFHQALKLPDASNFEQVFVKEVNGHVDKKHWELIKHSDVPKNVEIVPSVWAMHHKCNLITNKITKYKARLNIHGASKHMVL